MREVEVKVRVGDLDAIKSKLIDKGCVFGEEIVQEDTVFTTADNSFFETLEASPGQYFLRIRKQGEKIEFNLKRSVTGELDNIEHEVVVDDANALREMLLEMGYKEVVRVKKRRIKGILGNDEVCLDDVDDLGTFMEIERICGDDVDALVVQGELFKLLKEFGISENDKVERGYDTLMVIKHREKNAQSNS